MPVKREGFDQPGVDVYNNRREHRKEQRTIRSSVTNPKDKLWPGSTFECYSEIMSTEDDVDYINIFTNYCNNAEYIVDAILKVAEQGHVIGHWDEVVAAQQTAFDNYCQDWFELLFNLAANLPIHDLLRSFPVQTTAATGTDIGDGLTGNVSIALQSQDNIDKVIKIVQDSGCKVPNIIKKILKLYNFIIKPNDSWKVAGVNIPARYICFMIPDRSYDELVALANALRTNLVKAEKFCNQFGIPLSDFSKDDLEYEVISDIRDKRLITVFGGYHWTIRSTSDRIIYPKNALSTANASTFRWWFSHGSDPNESELNSVLKLICVRDGTYNLYGNLFATHVPTTDTYVGMLRCKEAEATEMLSSTVAGFFHTLKLFYATWVQTDVVNISTTGTYCGEVDIGSWPFAVDCDLKYYTKDYTLTTNILLKWMNKAMDFQKVKKEK